MAVPAIDLPDFHFFLHTITKIQDYPATANLVNTNKHSILWKENYGIQVQVKGTFSVPGIVNSNTSKYFECFISYVIQTCAITVYVMLITGDLMPIFDYYLSENPERRLVNQQQKNTTSLAFGLNCFRTC